MADVRALLKAKREEARITHPYAAYNPSGQLKCTVCGSVVKHASAWEGHLGSKAHRTNIIRLREQEKRQEQEQEQTPQESEDSPELTRKRKTPEDQAQSNINTGKKRRVETPSRPPQSSSSSSFPQDFFSDPSRAPVPLSYFDEEEEEEEEKPSAEKQEPLPAAAPGVDEEYERFQLELLSNPDPSEAYDRATVAAEPVLASAQIPGFPLITVDDAPEEPPQLTEEEVRQKREQEERELIMDKLLAEERAQEDADTRVQLLKIKLEALRKKREAAKANKLKDTR
ncbi:hypothetical protein CVT25_013918 [Psilocybe cyanescens]|uniref:Uncharacterized protein n=1 Tax=Psilocybe cyanescens TaxID=93625 RepID=A0A409XJP6_PSICY|nr:hypothetical protein CVT25_013918 [Psilocybe cyanescens]